MIGHLVNREDQGGDRITLEHCGKPMRVFYPNDDYDGLPFKAICIECGKPYHAREAITLWAMTQTL